ncbi:hypothetical protein JW868_02230 [Candidatus Woesearchaeota archaeon]|nr:hypothetical protein [Candidatus Woesearchaeota archaeon]
MVKQYIVKYRRKTAGEKLKQFVVHIYNNYLAKYLFKYLLRYRKRSRIKQARQRHALVFDSSHPRYKK